MKKRNFWCCMNWLIFVLMENHIHIDGFIVNFEHIHTFVLVFPLLTLCRQMPAGSDNLFFQIWIKNDSKVKGIPIGSDHSLFHGKSFFLFSVYGQVWKTNRKDVIEARQFSDMFWFIDDVAAIDDGQEFEKVWQWIYLFKLEMKCDSSSENEVSLLDFEINIVNKKLL